MCLFKKSSLCSVIGWCGSGSALHFANFQLRHTYFGLLAFLIILFGIGIVLRQLWSKQWPRFSIYLNFDKCESSKNSFNQSNWFRALSLLRISWTVICYHVYSLYVRNIYVTRRFIWETGVTWRSIGVYSNEENIRSVGMGFPHRCGSERVNKIKI